MCEEGEKRNRFALRISEETRQLASWEMAQLGRRKIHCSYLLSSEISHCCQNSSDLSHVWFLDTFPLPILPLHALWIHSRLLRCAEFAAEPKLRKYHQQVKMNQNSVKISLVQFSIFNTAKLTVDKSSRPYLSDECVSPGTQWFCERSRVFVRKSALFDTVDVLLKWSTKWSLVPVSKYEVHFGFPCLKRHIEKSRKKTTDNSYKII